MRLIEPKPIKPILIPARTVVLLIFMPSAPMVHQQRDNLTALAESLQTQLGSQIRVLHIDQATHPEVVQSFAITQTPAFVLVRQGVEIWRQEGLTDDVALSDVKKRLLLE